MASVGGVGFRNVDDVEGVERAAGAMINLYRGELHKVSGIVREWPLPKPTMTMSAFRQALEKRNAAWQGRPVSHSTSSSCLVRQDTGASGSQDASPLRYHHRSSAGAEHSERDEAGEGRGESDGNGKGKEPEYMEEDDVADEMEEGGGSRLGRRGSSGSNVDGSVPMEESFALISVKGNPTPADHECKPEAVEHGDNNNNSERKKRKREEAAAASSLLEAKKGKSKIKKEVVEPMAVDAAAGGGGEENEMYVERVGLGSGIDEVKEAGRGVVKDEEKEEEGEEEGVLSIGGLGFVKQERESSKSEERDPVKVEAPSTPPVHTEEQNLGNASVSIFCIIIVPVKLSQLRWWVIFVFFLPSFSANLEDCDITLSGR